MLRGDRWARGEAVAALGLRPADAGRRDTIVIQGLTGVAVIVIGIAASIASTRLATDPGCWFGVVTQFMIGLADHLVLASG